MMVCRFVIGYVWRDAEMGRFDWVWLDIEGWWCLGKGRISSWPSSICERFSGS